MFPPFDTFVCSPRPSSGSPGSAPAFPTFIGTMGSYDSCPARRRRSLVSLDRLLPLPPDAYNLAGGDWEVSQVPGEAP